MGEAAVVVPVIWWEVRRPGQKKKERDCVWWGMGVGVPKPLWDRQAHPQTQELPNVCVLWKGKTHRSHAHLAITTPAAWRDESWIERGLII